MLESVYRQVPAATHHFPPVFAQQTSAAAQSLLPVQGLVAAVPQSAGQVADVSPPRLLQTPSPHKTAPLHVASKSAQQLLSCLHSELHAHGMPARNKPQDPWHENALLSLRQPVAVPHDNKSVAVCGVPALTQVVVLAPASTHLTGVMQSRPAVLHVCHWAPHLAMRQSSVVVEGR